MTRRQSLAWYFKATDIVDVQRWRHPLGLKCEAQPLFSVFQNRVPVHVRRVAHKVSIVIGRPVVPSRRASFSERHFDIVYALARVLPFFNVFFSIANAPASGYKFRYQGSGVVESSVVLVCRHRRPRTTK